MIFAQKQEAIKSGVQTCSCFMQDQERKWPPIMTTGHVIYRGPVESIPGYNKSLDFFINFTVITKHFENAYIQRKIRNERL